MKRLLVVALLVSLTPAAAAEDQPPSPKQAVLKAVELAAGKGFYRHSVEVAVSEQDGKVTVLFRRPTSNVMETEGRKPTKQIWKATFQGKAVETESLDKEASKPTFDREYSQQRDQQAARAVAAALSHLGKGQKFDAKEFAVDVSTDEGRDIVVISHIPYTPDAHVMMYVYPDGRVETPRP